MIYLYPPGTKDLSSGGVPLFEAKEDRIVEVMNGRYDLSFKYPAMGATVDLKEELEDFSIIGADTPKHGLQPFVVIKPVKKDGYWHIEAKHVFFLLEIFNCGSIWITGGVSSVLQSINMNTENPDIFTFDSNIPRRISVRYEGGSSMGILCEGDESILAQARGELERDGYHVTIKERIGEDTEFLLAQRKNINDSELVKDYSKIITRLNVSKKIDHEKFIPRPNGEGKLTEPYPKTGGATLRVRYWDGTTGQLIEDGEGTFQVYDSNGYSIIGGMQTGSKRSIVTWRDKKTKYEETLEKDRERIKSLEERQTKNRENLKKQQGERTELANKYNSNKTESNRKRLESKDRAIENTNKSIKSTNEQLAKTKEKIAEYEKLLEGVPTVILGERKLDNVLAAGQYFIRMVRPADGYLMDHTVKRFYSDSSKEIVIDFHSNPTDYEEDDTVWVKTTVDSPIIKEYPYVFSKDVELQNEEMEVWKKDQPWLLNLEKTRENLYNWAYEEFLLTRMDLPTENFKFTAGSKVVSSGLGLGDRAVVYFSDYDLYKDLPVSEIEYSPMQRRYISLSFGEMEDSFFSELKNGVQSQVSGVSRRLEGDIRTLRRDSHDSLEARTREVLRNTADMMDYKDLERYFESEYIKQGLMEYVNEVGADNLSRFEVEMLHLTLFGEELDAKYGTLEENRIADRETMEEMRSDIADERQKHTDLLVKYNGDYNHLESKIDSTARRIGNTEGQISTLEQSVSYLTSTVADKANSTQITQLSNRISLLVNGSSPEASSFINMLEGRIKLEAPKIDLSGYVTFADINDTMDTTTIHGSRIETGTIDADRIGAGYLTSRRRTDNRWGPRGATSWIDMDTGEFSFMNGAFYHDGKTFERGELWCTSSFAVAYPGTNTRMCEFNAGGLYFFNEYENKVGLITAAGSAMNYNNPSGGGVVFRIGSTGRLYMSNQVNQMGWSGIGDSFKTLLNGDVYINGDLHVGGGVGQNKGQF